MQSFSSAGRARLAIISACVLAAAGCTGGRGGPIPYATEPLALPDPAEPAVAAPNFQLAPGDKLRITVFQVEDMTGEYFVDLSGNIGFPLLGTIGATGKTVSQLASELESRLGESYLRDPRVSVAVTESVGRQVTVEGGVRQPGTYNVVSETTLVSAIAMARGTDEYSNPRRVAVFRKVDGGRMAAAFDLVSIRRNEMADPKIYPGDIVVVESSATRQLLRDLFGALPVLALFRPY